MIQRDTLIEEIVRIPGAVRYLLEQNIRCLACGEPTWDTLEEAARQTGHSDSEIDRFVDVLNELSRATTTPLVKRKYRP